jgi:hypothetical protein
VGAIVGFVLGYVLGTRAGAEGQNQLKEAWSTITSSEELKDLLSGGISVLTDLAKQGRGLLADRLAATERPELTRVA